MSLTHWNAALASVVAGTGKARITCIGDSITFGAFATNYLGWTEYLRQMLGAQTAPAYQGIFYPYDEQTSFPSPASIGKQRPWVTLGTGWSVGATGFGILGDADLAAAAGTTGTFDFGPFPCDGFIVYYYRRSDTGTMDLQIDSESVQNVGGTGADAIVSTTITAAAPGYHTLHIRNVATNRVIIEGIEPIRGTGSGQGIYIANGGHSSTSSVDWTQYMINTNPWDTDRQLWTTGQPDLTIVALGIVDRINNVAVATYQTNLTTIVTKALAVGSCLLLMNAGATTGGAHPWSEYITAAQTVATANDVPLVNIETTFGGDITAAGGIYSSGDGVHPSDLGHYTMAGAVYQAITGSAYTYADTVCVSATDTVGMFDADSPYLLCPPGEFPVMLTIRETNTATIRERSTVTVREQP